MTNSSTYSYKNSTHITPLKRVKDNHRVSILGDPKDPKFYLLGTVCYRLNGCVLSNSYVDILTPQRDGIRRWGLWEVFRVRWSHENGILIITLIRRDTRQLTLPPLPFSLSFCPHACTENWLCKHTSRRQLSATQWERSYQDSTMLAPWSWTSSLQNCEKINVCLLSPQSVGFYYGNRADWTSLLGFLDTVIPLFLPFFILLFIAFRFSLFILSLKCKCSLMFFLLLSYFLMSWSLFWPL